MVWLLWGWTFVYYCIGTEALRRLRLAQSLPRQRPQSPAFHRWVVLRPIFGKGYPRTAEQLVPKTKAPLRFIYLAAEHDALGQNVAKVAVETLQHLGHGAMLQITKSSEGPNGKAAQLAQVPQEAVDGAWVISLDDDIDASTVHLDGAAARFEADPRLGAVWFPFVSSRAPISWPDRIAHSVFNDGPHGFELLAALAPYNVTGKILAYRPEAVAQVGGWGPRVRWYGDDLDLGQALLASGFTVGALAAYPGHMTRSGQSWREVWQRQRRWVRIIIDQKPILAPTYILYMGAAPLLLAAWVWTLRPSGSLALSMMGPVAVVGCRARLLRDWKCFSWPRGLIRLLTAFAADAFLLAALVGALSSSQVCWLQKSKE